MSGKLWLVRHGATDWSEAGRLNGWTDTPLNERGRAQAKALAERLSGIPFAGVWSSDLARAEETARLALGRAAIDPRLRELDFGRLEGRRWEECALHDRRALAAFDGFQAPGGESMAELRSRVLQFVRALPEGDHGLFTHGGVIRLLLRSTDSDRPVPPGAFVVVPREAFPERERGAGARA